MEGLNYYSSSVTKIILPGTRITETLMELHSPALSSDNRVTRLWIPILERSRWPCQK